MPAPGLFGSSKPCHFVSSCLIEWFVSKSPQIVCHPLSPGTSAFFLPVPEGNARVWSYLFRLVHLVVFFPFLIHQWWNPKKIWRGMPGSWPWLRFHIGFWHWLKLTQNTVIKWLVRRHFVANVASYKMIRPAENIPLTKWYGSEGKFCYKMIPFVGKMSPQRGHGSTHSITEIGTGIHLTNSSCHSYLWRLGNQSLAQPLHLPLAKFYRSILFVQSLRLPSFQVIFLHSLSRLPSSQLKKSIFWYTLPSDTLIR